ncbi:MAG: DegV family protein [Bacilli bacterium]
MNKITLISDTLCDLTQEMYKTYNIRTVPLSVTFKDNPVLFLDGVDITPDDIYAHVKETGALPMTGAIPPDTYLNIFKDELDKGNDVIYIGVGSGISSSLQNAILASKELDESRIAIVDSQSLSTGIALLVLKARKLIDEGMKLLDIKKTIENLVPLLSVKFSVDGMEYLYKGGRCKGLTFLVGKHLHIHPVIKVTGNKLIVYKKPRGNYEKAMLEMVNEFKKDLPNIDLDCVFITDSGPTDFMGPKFIEKEISQYVPAGNLHFTTAGSTVSSHCGPRTIGILYLLKK